MPDTTTHISTFSDLLTALFIYTIHCVLDTASFDGDGWTEENAVW